jgi:AcrR family transcriptional regulator
MSPRSPRSQARVRERAILLAALEELARTDYGGMTIEAVAARAGVNKTTVYRKWQTKAELIHAALHSVFETYRVGPTAGDLRSDLTRIASIILDFTHSFEGQCLTRLRLLQHPEPALAQIARDLNAKQLEELRLLVDAAAARGELAPEVDIRLLIDMMWGAIHARVVMKNEAVDQLVLTRIVDLLTKAVSPDASTKPRTAASRDKPARRTTAAAHRGRRERVRR